MSCRLPQLCTISLKGGFEGLKNDLKVCFLHYGVICIILGWVQGGYYFTVSWFYSLWTDFREDLFWCRTVGWFLHLSSILCIAILLYYFIYSLHFYFKDNIVLLKSDKWPEKGQEIAKYIHFHTKSERIGCFLKKKDKHKYYLLYIIKDIRIKNPRAEYKAMVHKQEEVRALLRTWRMECTDFTPWRPRNSSWREGVHSKEQWTKRTC